MELFLEVHEGKKWIQNNEKLTGNHFIIFYSKTNGDNVEFSENQPCRVLIFQVIEMIDLASLL